MRQLWVLFLGLSLSACDSSKDISDEIADGIVSGSDTCAPGNMPPFVYITSHDDGAVVLEGETETYKALVGDPDDDLSDLTVNWYVDGELVCEDAPVDADGQTECDITAAGPNSVIRVEVTDPDGYTDEDVVLVVDPGDGTPANTPPTCEITAPPTGSSGNLGETVELRGVVGDAEDAPEDLTVSWASDTLGVLGTSVADSAGAVELDTDLLSVGSHILILSVTDTAGATCVDFVGYEVQTDGESDNPPVVVITSPGDEDTYKEGEPIDFGAVVSDVEDEEEDLVVVWESDIDGVLSTEGADGDGEVGFSTDGLSPGEHIITVTVTDSDGNTTTDAVVIVVTENAGPSDPDVEIVPNPPYTNNDLYAVLVTEAVDPDGDPVTHSFSWTLDGVAYTEVSGRTIPSSATVKGQTWCVTVTASDGTTSSGSDTDCVVVQNTPPSIERVEIAPDTPTAGDPLTCAYFGFEDLDGDADVSRYSWSINGVYAGSGSTLTEGYVLGDLVTCTVTPSDGEDDGEPKSATVVIGNTAPVLASVTLGPDPAYTDDRMVCTPGSTTDADGAAGYAYRFRWEIDGVTVPGETDATLASSLHVKHQIVQCFATPSDGLVFGDEVGSNLVEIQNTPPTAPEIHVEPVAPDETDDLICVIDELSFDLDDDVVTYAFSWTVDGEPFSGATSTLRAGDTIASEHTSGGETWICTVVPFDGEDVGPSDSAGVTIEDQCPPIGGYGTDGTVTLASGEVRSLSYDVALVTGNHTVGSSSFTVDDASGFTTGDELLVVMVRGDDDDCLDSGAGLWSVVNVASIDGERLHLRDPLDQDLLTAGGMSHQVIRIPHFESVTLGASARLTAPAFDGTVGGVLIFRAQDVVLGNLASIDMDAKGFRGGDVSLGFGEHQGGRAPIWEGVGGDGGYRCTTADCVGGPGADGDGGAGGGSGGGVASAADGSAGGGGGGGAGSAVTGGGYGGVGATVGGAGATVMTPTFGGAGGGGGGPSAESQAACDDTDAERLTLGNGGQAGASGGCSGLSPAGGDSLGGGCGDGGPGGRGGGIVVLLADTLSGAAGASISADGASGGVGGDGADAPASSLHGGGGGGDGGEGAHGGRVVIVADYWGAGADLLDATASGGAGGRGGYGGSGSGTSRAAPGTDGEPGYGSSGGGGGAGQSGPTGEAGQVHVWGSWMSTATFPHRADPVYAMDFYGGAECFLEL